MKLDQVLEKYQLKPTPTGNIAHEFQDFAYRLAMSLAPAEDRATIGLCMRLAKQKPRALLERARDFVQDAQAHNKVALFLWKLKELEKDQPAKHQKKAGPPTPGQKNAKQQKKLFE